MRHPSDLYHYTPITQTSQATWPNGRRLAVYFVMGVESYHFGKGITEDLMQGMHSPDYANTSWRDYGNRVGAFRLQQRFAALDIPLSILLNTNVYKEAPQLTASLRESGNEIIAHGLANSDTLAGRDEANESAYLKEVFDRIEEVEGKPPLGWSSPWLSHTENTVDLLQENGYRYVLDWGLDDRPVFLNAKGGPLLHIPYGLELNDSSTVIGRQASAAEFSSMITDQFDELLLASEEQPLVMSVVVHSFISGQPFRLKQLTHALEHILAERDKIWLCTPDQICQAIESNHELAV